MNRVLTLIDRDTRRARSMVVEKFDGETVASVPVFTVLREYDADSPRGLQRGD